MSRVYVELQSFEAPGATVEEMVYRVTGGSSHNERLEAVQANMEKLAGHIPPVSCDSYECTTKKVGGASFTEFRFYCSAPIKLSGEFPTDEME